MQIRDFSNDILMSFVEFDADISFLYQVMDINEDLRELLLLQDVLKEVNLKVMEQWQRLQLSMSMHRLTQQEASLIRRVIITLQECERELEYLRESIPEPATCPKCGKPYFKEHDDLNKGRN